MQHLKILAKLVSLHILFIHLFSSPAYSQQLMDPRGCLNTAIGCIPTTTSSFTGFILTWSIYVGSGAAFLLLAYSAFQILTSQGDAKKIQAGQEMIISTLSGLIFIIFSFFIMRVIGVDILGIFKVI